MSIEPPFVLIDPACAQRAAETLFAEIEPVLTPRLPASAEILHIGATAVPGCLTKGDLDVVIRVPAMDFERADAALAQLYAPNQGSVRTGDFAAFEEPGVSPHLGLQLTAIGGAHDFFHLFVEALRRSPELVEAYNALKRRHDGGDMNAYRQAKDAFVAQTLADTRFTP